ncbi:hypothetical protein TNIN_396191 [Trichonephila inaurata madagascariensis]|uniref:Uncharacterized protein n=1 Tax=Trichonephila inaurata madagascariensis TaxID=2747483 RepID=A0A8X6X8G2_9ARAC|nr:hypothetical protein TNIN_396191 [Trichonephila inaurata madagascariensis]
MNHNKITNIHYLEEIHLGVTTAARTLVPQLSGSILEHTKQGNKRRCCSSRKTKPNGHKMLESPELFLKEDGTTCETCSSNSIRPEKMEQPWPWTALQWVTWSLDHQHKVVPAKKKWRFSCKKGGEGKD